MTSLDNKIIGQSKPAVELKKMIGLIASSGSPVIINGPTNVWLKTAIAFMNRVTG